MMFRGFYYSRQFNGEEHFDISLRDRRVGRWSKYETVDVGDFVVLWTDQQFATGRITGPGQADRSTWTDGNCFIAHPVAWTEGGRHRMNDVPFSRSERLSVWSAIRDNRETDGEVQRLLRSLFNDNRGTIPLITSFFSRSK